ncbi:DUF2946 family protein [Mesorhizobium marinum]|uniref:DUF2946 family protein n=1 Tax=Mesorhizobium marinum TaxID=3228790 RepID=A0ABV3QV25_9HYPH
MRQSTFKAGTARIAAFVAVLALVLQSAAAFAAPPVQRDIFGNIICVDGSTGQSPRGGGHGGGHMPDCCLLSCGGLFQPVADLPAAPVWPAVETAAAAITVPTPKTITVLPTRSPANPRAPPAA